jgi:hypothetical protein
MTDILLGPTINGGPTTKVRDKKSGKVFYKKQILPVGKFQYKDQELDLSDPNLATLVQSFNDKAYDEVTSQFGGTESEHNNDPLRRNGTVAAVEHVPGKGVFGYFDLTDDGRQFIEKFPNAGVSPRIVAGIQRADGKAFDAAIEHVLFTNVPRMTGMAGWEKVELSQGAKSDVGNDATVLDFSTLTAEPTRLGGQTTFTTKVEGGGNANNENEGNVSGITDEHVQFLNAMIEDAKKFENALGGNGDQQQQTAPAIPAELSQGVTEAQKNATTALAGIAALQAEARRDAWAAKKRELLSRGVPPAALDLADPIMVSEATKVIELSTAEGTVKSDERQVTLSMLETMAGTVDLGGERGHGVGGNEGDAVSQEDIDSFMTNFGL